MISIEEKKRFNVKKIVLCVLGALLVVGVIWFFRVEIGGVINRVPNNPIIVFPAVEDRTVLKRDFINNSVALEISRFITDGAEQKILWKLEYVDVDLDKIIGLELTYQLSQSERSLKEFYEEQLYVAKNNDWKLLAANIEDSQAFLDIERKNPSAGYKVRIYAEEKDNYLDIRFQYLIIRN